MLKRKATATKGSKRTKRRKLVIDNVAAKISLQGGAYSRRMEAKYVDIATIQQPLTSTPSINLVNVTTVGSNSYQRVGREQFNDFITIKGYIRPSTAASDNFYTRLALVWDSAPNGVTPSYGDIFQTLDQLGIPTSDPLSGPNMNNRKRFTVLRDQTLLLPTSQSFGSGAFGVDGNTCTENNNMHFKWYIPLKGIPTEYKGDSISYSDVVYGALWFIHVNQDPALLSQDWDILWTSRLKFHD